MWNIGGLIHLEVYVKRIFIHVHMHLRLVKFESFFRQAREDVIYAIGYESENQRRV